jgi:hypothetical protein
VAVRTIDRKEFDRLFPYTGQLTPFIGEAVEWFTDDARRAVGVIGRSPSQPAWRYAVLKRSQFGDFKVAHLGEALADLPAIRDECQRAVAAAEGEPPAVPPEVAAPQAEPTIEFQEKPWSSLAVVVFILAADVVVIGVIVLSAHHWH